MDSRILDLPLSPVVYMWLQRKENGLTLSDVDVCERWNSTVRRAQSCDAAPLGTS